MLSNFLWGIRGFCEDLCCLISYGGSVDAARTCVVSFLMGDPWIL